MRPFVALGLLINAVVSFGAHLTVSVSPSQLLSNPSTLPPTTHAVLIGPSGVRYDTPLRRDNTFEFPDLADATYLLNIHSRDYFFPSLRVDVTKADGEVVQTVEAWQTFRGNEWSNKGSHYGAAKNSLAVHVSPSSPKNYYQARGGFDLLSFFKSPMILIGLVSLVFVFGLPYLMENMDPETKAEFEEMQKGGSLMSSQGAADQIQNFDLAGWMAGRPAGGSTDAANNGGASKKR